MRRKFTSIEIAHEFTKDVLFMKGYSTCRAKKCLLLGNTRLISSSSRSPCLSYVMMDASGYFGGGAKTLSFFVLGVDVLVDTNLSFLKLFDESFVNGLASCPFFTFNFWNFANKPSNICLYDTHLALVVCLGGGIAIDSFSFLELEFLSKYFEKLFDLSSGIGLLIIIQWGYFPYFVLQCAAFKKV